MRARAEADGILRRAKRKPGPGRGANKRQAVISRPRHARQVVPPTSWAKRVRVPAITPRPYQVPVFEYWDNVPGPGRAVEVWARRCGKDLVYASVALMLSFKRRGLYLHFLPEFAHARRTLWDGFDNEGHRFIDTVIPRDLRKSTNEQEMRIELVNGSVWQLGGSDQYDRWVSGNPIWTCFSEAGITHPKAWEIMRPILKVNGGHAAFIGTPRGYNHFHTALELAKREPSWRWSHISAVEAGVMSEADIAEEIRLGMPEELSRQEYRCDFSAANVGAILGRYVEAAEREGRISLQPVWDAGGARIVVSSDIGFRDTAAFWFWQPKPGGKFALVDYDEDTGLDAEQWIERLAAKPWTVELLLLPHDANAKTFQSRHTVVEQFLTAGWAKQVKSVPAMKSQDKVNAARSVLSRCEFDAASCAQGLLGLREWAFKYDETRRAFSREPDHNWASHPADAFAYGASMLREYVPKQTQRVALPDGANRIYTLEQLYEDRDRGGRRDFIP